MVKILRGDRIVLGTCYYPEHWDESLWKDDLSRMKKNGVDVIRIAEFAWNKIEPREGDFTFDFFDRFLELTLKADMSVVFATPTATPPAWLSSQYPEILNARMDGVLLRHGMRRHYNYNSPVYRRFTETIVEKTARHYGPHPSIIGWQIDNELNCETDEFYSESDTIAFREFLKRKYGSLDALNDAWGTVFWNQTYTAWAEIHVPQTTVGNSVNPHRTLDYIRFVSDSACGFVKLQSDILRKYLKSGDFITTNGIFPSLDSHRMCDESLDFITYDSYPNMAYNLPDSGVQGAAETIPDSGLGDREWSCNLSKARSISPAFGVMEQQSGPGGWTTRMESPAPRPGQMTLWTMQSIAHGADYVGYFRWRTCCMGTEIYWHGILDYSNRDTRRLAELNDIRKKTDLISAAAGSRYRASFAVLTDYDNIWDARLDVWHGRVHRESEAGIFRAAQTLHSPADYVCFSGPVKLQDLAKYPVLFYPHPVIVTEERAALLAEYAASGGTLVLGARAGMKDISGKCPMTKLPGLFRGLSGTDVVDYTLTGPGLPVTADWDGDEIEVPVFNDILEPLADGGAAKVLASYTKGWYAGKAALIVNRYGRGSVYYFGGAFSRAAAGVFLKKLNLAEPYRDTIGLPANCEIAVREKENARFFFVLNYSPEPAVITVRKELRDLYRGTAVSGGVELPPFGTAVFEE
ncbi:MAG: beta-galactosidase [Treponema sp.]|jgi:beta-galactosidase|nr:beta-galactosidase [Treponema sp.]